MDSDPTTDGRSTGGAPRLPGRGEEPTQPPSRHADNSGRRATAQPLPTTGYGILASPGRPADVAPTPTATPPEHPIPVLPPSEPPQVNAATSFESHAAPTIVIDRDADQVPSDPATQPVPVAAPHEVTTAGTPQQAAVAAGFAAGGHVLGNPTSPLDPAANVEINPLTGLPVRPTGPLTPTPQWKSRVPTKGRKVRNIVIALVVGVVILGLLFLLFRGFLPSGDGESGDASTTDGAVAAIDDAEAVTDGLNDRSEVDAALDELGLDPVVGEITPTTVADATPPAGSYFFTWSGPADFEIQASVDAETKDFLATTGAGSELRRVNGRYFVSRDAEIWTELDPRAAGAIPVIGIDGPMSYDDVVPDVLEEFVIAIEQRGEDTTAVLVDEAWFAELNPAAHNAWLGPWGLLEQPVVAPDVPRDPDGPMPTEGARGEVLLIVTTLPDADTVSEAIVSSPAIGGTGTYTLVRASLDPYTVPFPLNIVD